MKHSGPLLGPGGGKVHTNPTLFMAKSAGQSLILVQSPFCYKSGKTWSCVETPGLAEGFLTKASEGIAGSLPLNDETRAGKCFVLVECGLVEVPPASRRSAGRLHLCTCPVTCEHML